jgi:hypothetical protein
MQQDTTINLQEQERMAAELQKQRQMIQQQQYIAYKQQTVMQIMNGLQQIDPFEVIKTISQYGVYTLQLEPQEKLYCSNLLLQLFMENNVSGDFTVENWRELTKILMAAINYTNTMQMSQIGRGGYNQFGMMGMGGGFNPMGGMPMGGGGFGNPMMGNQFGYNQFGMLGGFPNGMGMGQFAATVTPSSASENENSEQAITQFKQIFCNAMYQVDPIVIINYLLVDGFELKLTNNEMLINVLRQLIGNSLWGMQDNVLQIIYCVISFICQNDYQKKLSQNGMKQPNQGMAGMPPLNGMGMSMGGGFGNPMMGMGGGFNPMGGMPMGGAGFGSPMMGMGGGFGSPVGDFNIHPAQSQPSPVW